MDQKDESIPSEARQRLSGNVKAALERRGWSNRKLAERAGISTGAINRLVNGSVKSSFATIEAIARVLRVRPEFLLVDNENFAEALETRRLPVINYIQAGDPKQIVDDYAAGDGFQEVAVDQELAEMLGEYAFVLIVEGESMMEEFQPGDRVVIDPDVLPQPGDIVVAKLHKNETATLKKYRPRGIDDNQDPWFELIPLNNDWPTITVSYDNPGHVVGTVIEHRRKRRRSR